MNTVKQIKKRITKAAIYASQGIVYDTKHGKIFHPVLGWIKPLMKKGNTKLGKSIYTYSQLAGTHDFITSAIPGCHSMPGTCNCDCPGCYAKVGRYVFQTVVDSMARNTFIAMHDITFFKAAIMAQIKADKAKYVRIHAAGDFFQPGPISDRYIAAWHVIVKRNPETNFWTYTKIENALHAFDDLENCNVVNSIIDGIGLNYGKCGYILDTYETLKQAGQSVYICRCGIDPDQHCENCKGCTNNKYVLFIEHSTDYIAKEDPLYYTLKALIESQAKPE